jgi:hypothetical protein
MGIELSYQIRKLYTYDNLNVYMHIMCLPLFTEKKHNYIVNYYELVYIYTVYLMLSRKTLYHIVAINISLCKMLCVPSFHLPHHNLPSANLNLYIHFTGE